MPDPEQRPANSSATPASRVFGARLARLRQRSGMGVVEFAAKIGKSHAYVSRIERGHFMPRAKDLPILAAALGVRVPELMGDVPIPPTREDRALALAQLALEAARGVPIAVVGRVPGDAGDAAAAAQAGRVVYLADADVAGCHDPVALDVADDAMREIGIYPGDVLIVDRDSERVPRRDELVVISVDDAYTFVRWRPIETAAGSVYGFYQTYKPLARR